MSQPTIITSEEKRDRLKKLREFHQLTLDMLGVSNAPFIAKLAYIPTGKSEMYNAMFLSEINKGQDVFIEFADRDNVPMDPNRALYRWKFNPHFEEEYEKTEPGANGAVRYLIPVSELIVITPDMIKTQKQSASATANLTDSEQDIPLSQATLRDLAAIFLNKPVSTKPWLNQIITSK